MFKHYFDILLFDDERQTASVLLARKGEAYTDTLSVNNAGNVMRCTPPGRLKPSSSVIERNHVKLSQCTIMVMIDHY